jgi:DNA-binding response OmpR family regulator
MKILIVDDDPKAINALKAGLTSFCYEVISALGSRMLDASIHWPTPLDLLITDLKGTHQSNKKSEARFSCGTDYCIRG